MALVSSKAQALDFLLRASESGFKDAWDIKAGFRGTPLLMGTVFPIAIITTVLARPGLGEAARRVAVQEAETIASLADGSGWRYFNLYPAIPPDIDDFGTATRLLHVLDWPERDAMLAEPLALVRHNVHADGGFRNWLVEDLSQADEIGKLWVEGPDPRHPESTANLLEALCRVAPQAFEAELRKSALWLLGLRKDEGWRSWWYYGWAYGTLTVIRAFRAIAPHLPDLAPTLREAARQAGAGLLSAQNPDGSWSVRVSAMSHPGLDGDWDRPSPLETAMALSALAELGDWAPPGTPDALARAAAFLGACQQEDGGWSAEPFYLTLGMSPYSSRELTTALALDALILST
ncbi:Squalene--hopene cyclase [compost metagenome]